MDAVHDLQARRPVGARPHSAVDGLEGYRVRGESGGEAAAHRHFLWCVHGLEHPHDPARSLEADVVVHTGIAGAPDRHEVDHTDRTDGRLEVGLEHIGTGEVASAAGRGAAHLHLESATALGREHLAEHRGGVEALEAGPVDGAVSCHQRGAMTVADQRVVVDRPVRVAEREGLRVLRPGRTSQGGHPS